MMETTETRESRFVAPPLLTVAEAARLARVSRSYMWKLIRRDEVEAIGIGTDGGPIRVPTEPFLRWLYCNQLPRISRRSRTASGAVACRIPGGGGVTKPTAFESTPMTGSDMQWWEMYAKARATMRTEVVDYSKAAPAPPRPVSESSGYVYDPTPYWRGFRR